MRAIAVAVAVLVFAPAAGAASGLLLVDPGHPVVGKRTLIELRTKAKGPIAVQVTSPTGVRTKVRLVRAKPGVWRVGFHFADDGQWMLRVPRLRALAKVLVLQPGAALPPFKPNHGAGAKTNSAGSFATGGLVLGR
jgi:hypothetical protein